MKTIGWILACVLLVAVIAKNVIATSAANIKFSTGQNKKIIQFNTTRLELLPKSSSVHSKDSQSILDSIFKNEDDQDIERFEESRTFGRIRKLQFMLMPMLYKMGIMMTLMMVLIAISVKGLFVGIILLILKLSTFLAKFHTGWHASPHQPIHLHIHNSSPYVHSQMYHDLVPANFEDHYY